MTAPSPPRSRLREAIAGLPRPFWFLWGGVLVTRCGAFVLPFLALYLTQGLRLSPARAGLVVSLYGAGGAVAAPLGGWLADHVGRRVVMVAALGLGGAGMIALGFAHRITVLAPALFLVALVSESYRPAMQAAVSDLVAPGDRVRAFGFIYWVINLGVSFGLTVGGLIATHSFTWLFIGDGATTMAFAALIAFGVPETRPDRVRAADGTRAGGHGGFWAPYLDRTFLAFLLLSFLIALVFMQNATTFAVDMVAHGLSRADFGRVLAVNGVLIVLVQPFLAPVLAGRNRSRTLAAGAVLLGLGFGLNAVAHTIATYAGSVVVWTMGEMMVLPVANAVVADLAPVATRGRYQGAYGLSFALAVCVAPAIGMAALGRFGPVGLWSGCLVIGLVVAAGQLALGRTLTAARRARAVPDAAH